MTYDCMTPDELALWLEGAELVRRSYPEAAKKPCADCPLSFRLAEYAAGRCRLPAPVDHAVAEARRAYKREWMRRRRGTITSGTGRSRRLPSPPTWPVPLTRTWDGTK